jgi:hypothetical protein
MPRRSDSATRRWALTMMLPLRWFLAGATLPPRVPAVPCSIQRGAVVRRQSLPRRTDQHSSSSVIASRLTPKLSGKRSAQYATRPPRCTSIPPGAQPQSLRRARACPLQRFVRRADVERVQRSPFERDHAHGPPPAGSAQPDAPSKTRPSGASPAEHQALPYVRASARGGPLCEALSAARQ